jgi:phage terminase large subunit-like protein
MADPESYYREKLRLLEIQKEEQDGLPHLHLFKHYKWSRDFYESTNKMNLLTAANQISKSSTMIRKCIHWATDKALWPSLWSTSPNQFWYLYPSRPVASAEFETKWQQFLPKNKYRSSSQYGWKEEWDKGEIGGIKFSSGVNLYFKAYAQDPSYLQSGSVYAMFCDEELPWDLYPELVNRLNATDGHFHMVFTATLGQETWREAIEEIGTTKERFPEAFKQQISLYDSLQYEDGSPSPWNEAKIHRIIQRCQSDTEVQRRVFGKFVMEEGRKFPTFSRKEHSRPWEPIPKDWHHYSGVDIGSGGEKGHPASIAFVAVRPDFKLGYIFRGWRGDGVETTSGDILDKYREMKGALSFALQCYDHQSADFRMVADRQGESFTKADKKADKGVDIINTLFKNRMLYVLDIPELQPLMSEFMSVRIDTPKQKAKDDFVDAARFAISQIPWDFSSIAGFKQEAAIVRPKTLSELRRESFLDTKSQELSIEEEMRAWNELYEP